MKKTSIIPEIITRDNIVIFDVNEISVSICNKSFIPFLNNFIPPSIIVDNFEKRKYKDIEIRTIDLEYLSKFGYRLVSVGLKGMKSSVKNYRGQKKSYMLEDKTKPIPNSQPLSQIPKEHFIELDMTNNRIRIKGKNAFPYNRGEDASPWIQVKKI